ncbi:unnamed protein product [Arabis nemorensis]|uniref:Mediator complex subunit 15 KIX domain-containing protein n=1 Tax=Arabis nemorensis TaxID=586526 RepID=A0A565BST6_9BRAS|nr:unnamed protein product [Arabis nemorensis]
MEGNTYWKPNEQGGDSLVNNANDWKSHQEHDIRKKVLSKIVENLKRYFPNHSQYEINLCAAKFEDKSYGMSKDKNDYLRTIMDKMRNLERRFRNMQSNNVQSGSSVNGTNTPDPASQVLNQQQSLPTSLPYTQTPTSQQWLPQNIPSNLNIPESSGLPTQIDVLSQEQRQQEQEQLISQLMNGPDTHQNHHLTTQQNNGDQHGAFRVSSSSEHNNLASFRAQQSNNLPDMHQQRLRSHGNNASAFPSQQQQNILGCQSGNFNVPGTSLLGTQGQEVGQSQSMMLQQYQPQHPLQQPQSRSLQQNLDSVHNDTQRFQAADSLHQTQNIPDQQNQPYQLQRTPPASQDSTSLTVNASGYDWQEETYQKIKALKNMYLPVLSTMLQKVVDKLREIDSLPPQKMLYEPTEKLRVGKSTLEQVIVFLNVHRSSISEKHRDRFSIYEDHVLRLTKSQFGPRKPMQQQQGIVPPSQLHQAALQSHQVHVSQSLDNNQMNSQLIPRNQNGASSSLSGLTTSQTAMPHSLQTRPKMEPKDENNIMASLGNVVLPSLKQISASTPQAVHSNISSVQSCMFQQQQPSPHQQANQRLQLPTSHQINDARMRQGMNIKAGLLEQHVSPSQRQIPKPLVSPAQKSNFSPLASSPKILHNSSPQLIDQQILHATVHKTGTPSQYGGSRFVSPSPLTTFSPSPIPGDPERPISVESPVSHAYLLQTSAQPPQFTLPPEPIPERPIHRLINAFQSSSQRSLAESACEMSSIISMADRIAGSFHSGGGSRAGLAEDLSSNFFLQEGNLLTHGETNPTKRLKREISTQPLDIATQTDDVYKQYLESEVDSTASSGSKDNKIEPGCALLKEINEINGRLVETVVDICNVDVYPNEVTSGIIVSCSYSPVTLSATFKAHYQSGLISQIQPLRLLVPANYPYSSPIPLEKLPLDASVQRYEDLSARTRSRFSYSMKELSEPMSLKDIVQMWNDCARATMTEYAERYGGGTFSSKYGTWETVLRAS